jgi:hypothetical protein
MKLHLRDNIAKLIHNWIPTNAFLHKQNHAATTVCLRCGLEEEAAQHLFVSPQANAVKSRAQVLYTPLDSLQSSTTSQCIGHI